MSSVDVTSDEENIIEISTTVAKKRKNDPIEKNNIKKGFSKLIFVQENKVEFLKHNSDSLSRKTHDKTNTFMTFGINTKQNDEGVQETIYSFNQDMTTRNNYNNDIEQILQNTTRSGIKDMIHPEIKSMSALNEINKELSDLEESIDKVAMTQRIQLSKEFLSDVPFNNNNFNSKSNQYLSSISSSHRTNNKKISSSFHKQNSSRLYKTLDFSSQTQYYYNY